MKIAIFIEKIEFGGIQTIGFGLADKLSGQGHEVHIVHGHRKIDNFCPRIKKFEIGDLINTLSIPLISLKTIFNLARYLHKNKPDVIHSMGFPLGIIASILARRKILTVVTSQTKIKRGNKVINTFLINRFVDKVILTSDYHRKIFPLQIKKDKFIILPNMIDLGPEDGRAQNPDKKVSIPDGVEVLLSIGRLTPGKRVDVFLKMLKKLTKTNPKIYGIIIGSGPALNDLKQLANQLQIQQHVRFEGSVVNISDYFQVSKALVHTTEREIQPMLLLEAGVNSFPVICSDIGGNKSIITNKFNGILARVNDVDDFAEKVEWLLKNEDMVGTLTQNGLKRIETTFSSDILTRKYLNLYDQHLKKI